MAVLLVWVFHGSFEAVQIYGEIKVVPVQKSSVFKTRGHIELK